MKKLLLLLSGCLLEAGVSQAQTSSTASATTSSQQLAQDLGVERIRTALTLSPTPVDSRNVTSLLQMGAGNLTIINQTSQAILANQATIQQNGTGNMLNLDQTGSNNQTNFSQTGNANQAALSQNGITNTIVGQVTGNNNNVDVDQIGTGNQYSTQLTGNQGRYVIDQVGNNNSLTQRETSTSTPLPGYEVKMEGNNMHLTIEQGKVFP